MSPFPKCHDDFNYCKYLVINKVTEVVDQIYNVNDDVDLKRSISCELFIKLKLFYYAYINDCHCKRFIVIIKHIIQFIIYNDTHVSITQ